MDRDAFALGACVRIASSRVVDARFAQDPFDGSPRELEMVLVAWQRVPHRYCIEPVDTSSLSQQIKQAQVPILLVLSNSVRQDHELLTLLRKLEMCDPRQVRALSVLSLFEQHQ